MRVKVQSSKDLFDKMIAEMGSMVDSMMRGRHHFSCYGPGAWEPPLNFYEVPERFIVCVDLAGMQREQIEVRVEGQILHIRGNRPKPQIPGYDGEVSVHVMEIDSGPFHRQVPIPGDVDIDAIEAFYRNGYVWIYLPRV